MTRILLIRHAEAYCNVERIWVGHDTCRGLTPTGHAQADALRRRLEHDESLHAATIVTSEMRRAIETAAVLRPALPSAPGIARDCGLCERHPGSLDGMRLNQTEPAPDQSLWDGADAEGAICFFARVAHALNLLAKTHADSCVIAITHGGVIVRSFAVFGGVEARLPFNVVPSNASITEWVRKSGSDRWLLVRYNDDAHIAGCERHSADRIPSTNRGYCE